MNLNQSKKRRKILMKKLLLLVLAIFMTIAMVGCNQAAEKKETLKVALAVPGAKTDGGWSQIAYNGLLQIEEKLGAEVSINENTKVSDYAKILRDYAKAGNDIVIGHGFEFGDPALEVADEFPDTFFIVTSSTVTNGKNVGSVSNFNLQAGFLQGAFAALMTKTNVVGAVGGTQIPTIVKTLVGFELGAKYINPNIKTLTAVTGSGDDANKSKEQALAFIAQGADVLMANANAAGRGVYVAAEEKGVYAIASISGEFDKYNKGLIASTKVDMSTSLFLLAEQIQDGTYKAKAEMFGVKEGIVNLVFSPTLESKIPNDVMEKVEDIKKKLSSGEIDVIKLAPEEYR
jgi:basic membrane protein A and related proteins